MEQNITTPNNSNKKIIFIIVGILIVALAIVTVLKKSYLGSSVGLPGGTLSGSSMSFDSSVSSAKNLSMVSERSMTAPVASDESAADLTDKKIIKNGDLDLKVNSVDDVSQKISNIAKNNSGEIASSNFYQTASNLKSGNIVVKVPVANFETAFGQLKKVASLVVQESTTGQDVTEQYADLQAQLKNKQAEEQQYLEILKQAQKISDILEVTQQLSQVRGEIERLQGRIRFMDSQTDMSSIAVTLSEDTNITISDSWRPLQVIKETFNGLIKSAQGVVNFLIVLIIQIIPVLVLYILIFYVIYRIGKKIYLKVKNR
jgi:hypothetical protein